MTWPVDRYGIIHRDVALASGISERTISRALRRHEIHGVGRGRYILTRPLAGRDDAADLVYIATCIAAATGVGGPVLSHDSAAAVHGLPTLFPDRTHVHVTNGRDGGGTRRGARIVHAGLFGPDDVVEVDGVVVTSLERTCVDLATARDDLPEALTVFDAALRAGASTEGMERHLRTSKRGVAMARRAYSFADPRAESPGESWSRAQMIDAGLPLPDLQVEHLLGSGRLARCDFGVDGVFVGEFDGLVKYRREMRRGEPPEQVVIREKLREDGLRALGLDVGRWIWDDLRAGRLVARLEERYDRIGIRYG